MDSEQYSGRWHASAVKAMHIATIVPIIRKKHKGIRVDLRTLA